MPVNRPKGNKGKADRLFSELVRARGLCERCGESRYSALQTAHIYSRRFSNTRCDPDNAFCLCARCHRYFTDRPIEFAEFCKMKLGETKYQQLREKAQNLTTVDWAVVVDDLTAMLNARDAEFIAMGDEEEAA